MLSPPPSPPVHPRSGAASARLRPPRSPRTGSQAARWEVDAHPYPNFSVRYICVMRSCKPEGDLDLRGTLGKWRRRDVCACCPRTPSHRVVRFSVNLINFKCKNSSQCCDVRQLTPVRSLTQIAVVAFDQPTLNCKACASCRSRLSPRARARTLCLSARARTPSARMPLRPATPAPPQPHHLGTPTLGLLRRFLWVFRCLDARLRSRYRAPLPGVARSSPLRADTCLRPSTGPKAVRIARRPRPWSAPSSSSVRSRPPI